MSKVENQKPKTLPQTIMPETINREGPEIEKPKNGEEPEKRPNMVLIDYDRISRDIRNQIAENDRKVNG